MRPTARRLLCLILASTVGTSSMDQMAAAASWAVGLGPGSQGETQARGAPAAPGGVAAACVGLLQPKITVSWNLVSLATTYTIYQSTTSASLGFSPTATSITGQSWTSGNLAIGNYWYEVGALIGSNWSGPLSSATAESTITVNCIQP
jgi:hypothetical protein